MCVDLLVWGRGSGATLVRGRLLPLRGFQRGMYASKACCSAWFDLWRVHSCVRVDTSRKKILVAFGDPL